MIVRYNRLLGFLLLVGELVTHSPLLAQCFQPVINYPASNSLRSMVMSDVNADGRADAITVSSDAVHVLMGRAGGTFSGPTSYSAGSILYTVTVHDVNEDGRPDIIAADQFRGNISVLLGQGGGRFGSPSYYSAGLIPNYVAVSDVNKDSHLDIITDGSLDIVITEPKAFNTRVAVMMGNGDGSFGPPTLYPSGGGHLVVSDINTDGQPDIITANTGGINDESVAVLLGKGDGSFSSLVSYSTGKGPRSVAVSDINADGYSDIVTANFYDGSVSVLLGQGDGRFGTPTHYSTGRGPLSVAISDINRDGLSDVITANYSSSSVSVLLGKPGGNFLAATDYAAGINPHSLTVNDINSDTYPDIITGNISTVSTLLGGSPVTITKEPATGSSVCIGATVSATVSVSGTNSTYRWYKGNLPVPGQTSPTLSLTNVQSSSAGNYVAVITGCNSVTSLPFSLTVNVAPGVASITGNTTLIQGSTSQLSNATPGGVWSSSNPSIATIGSTGQVRALAVGSAIIHYTVSGPNGCTAVVSKPLQILPGSFAITQVTMDNCTLIDAAKGGYRVQFTPQYVGKNTNPVSFSVVNELAPVTAPPPYSLRLYADNPVITLVANQGNNGEARYTYNWLASCKTGSTSNQQPTARRIPDQRILVNQAYQLDLNNYFSDPEGQNLFYSATGLPIGLAVNGIFISGIPSTTGVSNIQVTATDPGGLSVSSSFQLSINSEPNAPSDFTIASITTIDCELVNTGLRKLTFIPRYSGSNGSPIIFSVVNEMVATAAPGPYRLNLYTDNPRVTVKAQQDATIATYSYSWLDACLVSTRQKASETESGLQVKMMGNPVIDQSAEIELSGVTGQAVQLNVVDLQGKLLHSYSIKGASSLERISLPLGNTHGTLLLDVTTATQHQQVKLLRP